tara:strand:- start:1320 stop:1886 length:567 start_codon:yes stop_codon:yes gene_type:complete
MTNKITAKDIWETLSNTETHKKTEKKGNYTYLSWADAWIILMSKYPTATYEIKEPTYHNDTVMVHTTVTIEGITHSMFLGVMNNVMKAIANPTSRDIADSQMRCFAKNISMFGLAINLWKGEDIPVGKELEDEKKRRTNAETYAVTQLKAIKKWDRQSPESKKLCKDHKDLYQKLCAEQQLQSINGEK